jgi:hypothetical protein
MTRRIKVFVPTYAVLALLALALGIRLDLRPFDGTHWATFWTNCLLGPLAWVRWNLVQPKVREVLPFLSVVVPGTLAMLAHPFRPNLWTGGLTVLGTVIWFITGYVVNIMGGT